VTLPLDGIDVSYAQGAIDWRKAGGANLAFYAAKATQNTKDAQLDANKAGMRQWCPNAVHIYYHFITTEPAAVQAQRFYDAVGPLQPGETVMLDCEAWAGHTPELPADQVLLVLVEIEHLFHRVPIIYMGAYYLDAADPRYGRYPLWLAAYNDHPHTVRPYIIHQFTDAATAPGISGSVDGNHVLDLAALQANAQANPPPPAPTPEEPAMLIIDPSNKNVYLLSGGKLVFTGVNVTAANWLPNTFTPTPAGMKNLVAAYGQPVMVA
jgi:GH25 family lysozyme M1 (1,4-beta-N-acetylmuramidase)